MAEYQFPADFVWGAATAAFQVEGAAQEDGRGESVWDRFSHTPGRVFNGDTGDVAADHYHRWQDDIRLMQDIGLNAYRFSIAWPRILPNGVGEVNEAGLAFYDRLVDGLLEAGITPFITLYHWDLPQVLQDRQQGWASRQIVDQYVNYADIVSRRLGDRVRHWATFNEPRVFISHGYQRTEHAPALGDRRVGIQAAHHVLLAHGSAVRVLRENVTDGQIGIVYAFSGVEAPDANPETLARQRLLDAKMNRWFIEPALVGTYPQVLLDSPDFSALEIQSGDMATIHAPVDWVGINYYSHIVLKGANTSDAIPVTAEEAAASTVEAPKRTAMGWEIYPQGLYDVMKQLIDSYNPPALYVTENGAAFEDVVTDDGRVHDTQRVRYLRDHFRVAHWAIEDGVPLKGYFVWSLLDNFEWAHGYSKRFGITYIDYDTQARILKDSGYYYQRVIAANAAVDIE